MLDKKRNRPYKHAMLHSDLGRVLIRQIAGENRCERSYLNISYQQNVIDVLLDMKVSDNDKAREAAKFWMDRMDKTMQGLKIMFYAMGKIDDRRLIESLLVEGSELIQKKEIRTMTELKTHVNMIRKSMESK